MNYIKLVNKYINDIQSYLIKNSRILGYPSRIVIDSTNYCQLKCPLCPTPENMKKQEFSKLKYTNFKKICDEIGKYLYKVTFFNWGEPLLNEELPDCIKEATKHGIRSHVCTNLNTYSYELLEKLVCSGLYKLTIAIDGTTQEIYEKYSVNGNLQKVLNGIDLINEIKSKKGLEYPILVWQFIVMKHNEFQIEEAKKMADERNMKFRIKAVALDESDESLIEEWYPSDRNYQRKAYSETGRPYIDRCIELWNLPVIDCRGNLSPCAYFSKTNYSEYNVFLDGFKKAWNSPQMVMSRKAVKNKKFINNDIPCCTCEYKYSKKSFTEFVKAIKRRGSSGLGIKSIWGNKKHKKWQEYMKRKNVYERYN